MWEGFHKDRKIPISISVEFDEETELYIVEVKRGTEKNFKTFTPKHIPHDGLMHISDMEKSVKKANQLVVELKKLAITKNKKRK